MTANVNMLASGGDIYGAGKKVERGAVGAEVKGGVPSLAWLSRNVGVCAGKVVGVPWWGDFLLLVKPVFYLVPYLLVLLLRVLRFLLEIYSPWVLVREECRFGLRVKPLCQRVETQWYQLLVQVSSLHLARLSLVLFFSALMSRDFFEHANKRRVVVLFHVFFFTSVSIVLSVSGLSPFFSMSAEVYAVTLFRGFLFTNYDVNGYYYIWLVVRTLAPSFSFSGPVVLGAVVVYQALVEDVPTGSEGSSGQIEEVEAVVEGEDCGSGSIVVQPSVEQVVVGGLFQLQVREVPPPIPWEKVRRALEVSTQDSEWPDIRLDALGGDRLLKQCLVVYVRDARGTPKDVSDLEAVLQSNPTMIAYMGRYAGLSEARVHMQGVAQATLFEALCGYVLGALGEEERQEVFAGLSIRMAQAIGKDLVGLYLVCKAGEE